MALFGGFQIGPFQLNYQQDEEGERDTRRVVLFPRQPLYFKRKVDLALYALAIYAKDCAVRAGPRFPNYRPRPARETGFELDQSLFGSAT